MNPNLDNLIIRLVPNEYIFAADDDLHRISTIVNMVNNKVHGISEDKLIKAVIFHILRETNFKTETIVPYLIIGLEHVTILDLNSAATTNYINSIGIRLLNESNEVKSMDKINHALSSIVDKMPIDLKETMTPSIKQSIVQYLMSLLSSIKESFSVTDTPTPAPSDTSAPTPIVTYSSTPTPTSSLTPAPTPRASSTTTTPPPSVTSTPNPSYRALRDESNKVARGIAWKYYLQAGSDNGKTTESSSNSDSTNLDSTNCANRPILAQYVDNQPALYAGLNNKVYIYDKTSNTLHYMPNKMENISISDLEKLLKSYKVSPDQIQATINDMKMPTATPIPSVAVTTTDLTSATSALIASASTDTSKLIDVIKQYQSEYVVTNYIVMAFLAFITLCILVYIVYKLYMYSTVSTVESIKSVKSVKSVKIQKA